MTLFLIYNIIFSFLIAFLLVRYGKKVPPSDRCSHEQATATSGGLIFVVMFFVNALYFYITEHYTLPWTQGLGAIIIATVGYIDDQNPLSYKFRLIAQFLAALCVLMSGYVVKLPLLFGVPIFGLDKILTILLVMGLINACNFFDGINGLLSGCVILTLAFSVFALHCDLYFIGLIAIPLLIFYGHNFPKAKVFMGDVGSTFLGYYLSILSLKNQHYFYEATHTALIHKGLIFTLSPMMFAWFDVFLTLLRRLIDERHIFSPWRDYLFHHLYDMNLGHKNISFIYYGLTLLTMGLTFSCLSGYVPFLAVFFIYLIFQAVFVVVVLRKHHTILNKNQDI